MTLTYYEVHLNSIKSAKYKPGQKENSEHPICNIFMINENEDKI